MPDTNYTPYTKTTWQDGDQITTNKMMNIENGVAALSAQVEEALGSTYGSLNDRMTNGLINTDGNVLLKGDLRIQKEHPALYFLEEESVEPLGGLYQVNDGQGNNRIVLYQRVPNSEIEAFFLPVPSEHTVQTNYSILTSKNPVSIACGGTGATTAEQARINLGLGVTFSELITVGTGQTLTLQRADTSQICSYVVFVGSANNAGKDILIGHIVGDTAVSSLVSLRSASSVTIATTKGQATIQNNLSSANLWIKILVLYGTTLTYSIA